MHPVSEIVYKVDIPRVMEDWVAITDAHTTVECWNSIFSTSFHDSDAGSAKRFLQAFRDAISFSG